MIGPWSEAGSVWGTMRSLVPTLIAKAGSRQTKEALADTGCPGVVVAWMEEI
jgi:hypothetical protein